VLQGTEDWLGLKTATDTYDYAKEHGVKAELKLFHPDETGAAHCQIDNPTLGQEFICDWIAIQLGIDQRAVQRRAQAAHFSGVQDCRPLQKNDWLRKH
jgi:hypothetical protein